MERGGASKCNIICQKTIRFAKKTTSPHFTSLAPLVTRWFDGARLKEELSLFHFSNALFTDSLHRSLGQPDWLTAPGMHGPRSLFRRRARRRPRRRLRGHPGPRSSARTSLPSRRRQTRRCSSSSVGRRWPRHSGASSTEASRFKLKEQVLYSLG